MFGPIQFGIWSIRITEIEDCRKKARFQHASSMNYWTGWLRSFFPGLTIYRFPLSNKYSTIEVPSSLQVRLVTHAPLHTTYALRTHPVLAVNAAGQVTGTKLTDGLSDPPNH